MRTFTPHELALCDGRDGRPSYVACDGTVYDVGESFLWRRGRHTAEHEAGRDLTEELAGARHGAAPERFRVLAKPCCAPNAPP